MDKSTIDNVLPALRALLVADATLIGAPMLNGQHVYLRMSSETVQQIPGIHYYLADVGIEEGVESAIVRWEVWATTFAKALAIEKRLRLIVHREQPRLIGGELVLATFEGSFDAPTAAVNESRRIVETRLEIVRQRAAA